VLAAAAVLGALVLPLAAAAAPASAAADPSSAPSRPDTIDPSDPSLNDPDNPRATFGIQPANTIVGNEQFAFDFGVAPGSQIFDNVAIVNFSSEPLTLGVYPVDAFSTPDGQFGLGLEDDALADAGSWITVGDPTTQVDVPAQSTELGAGRVFLPVAISVPPNAEPGDHAAGIVTALRTLSENPQGQNVELEQRVALRVYVRVAGELKPGITVTNVRADYKPGARPWQAGTSTVTYTVANTGNIRLGFTPSVSVEGPFGLGRREVTGDPVIELLPRGQVDITQDVDGVWPLLSLQNRITVTPQAAPRVDDPGLDPVTVSVRTTAIPWIVLAILVVIVILIVVAIVRRRRRRGPAAPRRTSGTPDGGAPGAGEKAATPVAAG
jgi:hypothetical protein